MLDDLEPLTDAEVQAGARPGESWEEARRRLEEARQEGQEVEGFTMVRVPYGALPMPPEQIELLWAYRQLSSREQFKHWGASEETLDAIERAKAKRTRKDPRYEF